MKRMMQEQNRDMKTMVGAITTWMQSMAPPPGLSASSSSARQEGGAEPPTKASRTTGSSTTFEGNMVNPKEDFTLEPTQLYIDKDGLTSELRKHIGKKTQDFTKNVRKFLKARKHLEKCREDIEVLDIPGRYLRGVRPYRTPETNAELDEPLEEAKERDWVLTIPLAKGCTMREACATVHHCSARFLKEMDMRTAKIQTDKMVITTRKSHFFEMCAAIEQLQIDSLGLDDPVQIRVRREAIETEAQKQYMKVIESVRKEKFLELKEKQENEKKKAEVDRKILETRPDELLKGLVRGVIKEVVKEDTSDEDDCDMLSGTSPPSEKKTVEQAAKEVCAALKDRGGSQAKKLAQKSGKGSSSKNGPPPGLARGQSSKGNGKTRYYDWSEGSRKGGAGQWRPQRAFGPWAARRGARQEWSARGAVATSGGKKGAK